MARLLNLNLVDKQPAKVEEVPLVQQSTTAVEQPPALEQLTTGQYTPPATPETPMSLVTNEKQEPAKEKRTIEKEIAEILMNADKEGISVQAINVKLKEIGEGKKYQSDPSNVAFANSLIKFGVALGIVEILPDKKVRISI